MKITRKDIIEANRYGATHRNENPYRTPVLMVACDLGSRGILLDAAPTVSGYRYGRNDVGVSSNYREGVSEQGLSLAALDGDAEVASAVWFEGPRVHCTGILLPYRGSDGEPLILPVEGENWDE